MKKIEDKIAAIEFYTREAISFSAGMAYEEFVQDHKTVAAVSMMVIAIAEIVRELPDWFTEQNPSINWFEIRGMRDRLAHNYRELSLPILYEVVTTRMLELLDRLGTVRY